MLIISSSLNDLKPPSRLYGRTLLQSIKPVVEAARGHQLAVGAGLGDPAVFEDQDLVYVLDEPELVGDDKGGATGGKLSPVSLNGFGGFGVKAGLRLVEDKDGGVAPRARSRSPLASFG
jgi:hypothetical protein